MLVFSRIADESVMIGDDLELQVVEVTPSAVRLRAQWRTMGGRLTKEIFDGARSIGESVELSEGLKCLVVDIRAEKVRLGLIVPRNLTVHRREVWEAIRSVRHNDDIDLDS